MLFKITLEQLQGKEEIGEDCQNVKAPLLYKVNHHLSFSFIKFFFIILYLKYDSTKSDLKSL